jgi:hypothetical protein
MKAIGSPLGYEQVTGMTSAKSLTPPAQARYALIQPTGQSVRYRDDGTAPTATVGSRVTALESLWYGGDLSAIQFFQEAATAVLNVSYYG